MTIALLSREFPPEVYGGAGVHVEHLAEALARLAPVEVHCFGGPRPSPLVASTHQPWEALEGDAAHLSALRTMSADLSMAAGVGHVELVHSHTWYTNLAGHLAKLLYDIPHVVTTHSLEPLRPWKAEQLGGGYALSSFCERTAIEHADAVIAVSEGMRDDVLAAYPKVPEERVHVVHNGIDAQVYQPDPGTDALERLGIDPSRPAVVFLGRITRQKGLPGFLAAARAFATDAQVVLLAGAPDTAAIAAEAREGVRVLRSSRDVVWIDEMLPRPDVVQILSHASVFVCPSVYEPFGLVNLEAMACGAPVVATATGGIPEVVVDGETGWLVPPPASADDASFADALADRVNALLADPATSRRFGAAGRARVLDRFTWPAIAKRTLKLYAALGVSVRN